MKLAIFGDVHGYVPGSDLLTIDVIRALVASLDIDAALQVGDLCTYPSFARPFYWIYGNRDFIGMINAVELGEDEIENLIHLKTGQVASISARGEQLTISGLNGAYEPLYYEYEPRELMEFGVAGHFVKADVEKCLHMGPVDIFLAHGCPAGLGFGREPDHAVPHIKQILDRVRPRYMFCGHAHYFRRADYRAGQVYALAPASDEYYMLDTATGELTRAKTEAALSHLSHHHTPARSTTKSARPLPDREGGNGANQGARQDADLAQAYREGEKPVHQASP